MRPFYMVQTHVPKEIQLLEAFPWHDLSFLLMDYTDQHSVNQELAKKSQGQVHSVTNFDNCAFEQSVCRYPRYKPWIFCNKNGPLNNRALLYIASISSFSSMNHCQHYRFSFRSENHSYRSTCYSNSDEIWTGGLGWKRGLRLEMKFKFSASDPLDVAFGLFLIERQSFPSSSFFLQTGVLSSEDADQLSSLGKDQRKTFVERQKTDQTFKYRLPRI